MSATLESIATTRGYSIIEPEERAIVRDAAKGITLDGHRATVYGTGMDFAQIATLGNGPRYTVEFSWQTAARVILNGGKFKS